MSTSSSSLHSDLVSRKIEFSYTEPSSESISSKSRSVLDHSSCQDDGAGSDLASNSSNSDSKEGHNSEMDSIDITLKDFSFSIGENIILKNINAAFRAGEFVVCLGPSGSGKTTLLNCIAKRSRGSATGEILFNGTDLPKTKLSKYVAYVMSTVSFLPNFTVRETLEYAARLKDIPADEIPSRVSLVLYALGMMRAENVMVGGERSKSLSTGERKRLSIAQDIIENPNICLLDEPTTGLDSQRAQDLMPALRNMARDFQKTVVATIHQPSSPMLTYADKVMVLVKGHICYYGPPQRLVSATSARIDKLFGLQLSELHRNTNPADFILDLVTPTAAQRDPLDHRLKLDAEQLEIFLDSYSTSNEQYEKDRELHEIKKLTPAVVSANPIGFQEASRLWFKNVGILISRDFYNTWRDWKLCLFIIIGNSFMALLFSIFFWQDAKEFYDINEVINQLESKDVINVYFSMMIGLASISTDILAFAVLNTHPATEEIDRFKEAMDSWPIFDLFPPEEEVPPTRRLEDTESNSPFQKIEVQKTKEGYKVKNNFQWQTAFSPSNPELAKESEPAWEKVSYFGPDSEWPLALPTDLDSFKAFRTCLQNKFSNEGGYTNWTQTQYELMENFPSLKLPTDVQDDQVLANFYTDKFKFHEELYNLLNMLDFVWYGIDWSDLPNYNVDLYSPQDNWVKYGDDSSYQTTVNNPKAVGLRWWLKLMICYGDEMNFLLGCMKFPELPSLSGAVKNYSSVINLFVDEAETKALINCQDDHQVGSKINKLFREKSVTDLNESQTKIEEFLVTFTDKKQVMKENINRRRLQEDVEQLRISNEEYSEAMQQLVDAVRACNHPVCEQLDEELTWMEVNQVPQEVLFDDMNVILMDYLNNLGMLLNEGGLIFFTGIMVLFSGMDIIYTSQKDKIQMNRERANGMYKVEQYGVAKLIAVLPLQLTSAILSYFVMYAGVGLDLNKFFTLLPLQILNTLSILGLNTLFAYMMPNVYISIIFIPPLLIYIVASCGFFIREYTWANFMKWTKWLSIGRWTYRETYITLRPPGEFTGGIPNELALAFAGFTLDEMQNHNTWEAYMFLSLCAIILRGLTILAMKYCATNQGLDN